MRILLKILLFPITLILTVILLFCEFICLFGTAVLSVLAFIIFVIALGTMIFLGEVQDGIKAMILAYLVSPYGIPMFAGWLIGILQTANERLKAI